MKNDTVGPKVRTKTDYDAPCRENKLISKTAEPDIHML